MLLLFKRLDKSPFNIPLIFIILLLTLVIYLPTLWYGFLFWDDPVYILENPMVNGNQSILHLFSKSFEGHYHPITLLSFRLDFFVSQGNPWFFHLNNIILHLLNTWLVWKIVLLLSREKTLAIFVSILFALHPLQVEAVSWITARKDLLYAFFFFLSLLGWLRYTHSQRKQDYLLSWCCFLFACLSKAQALMLFAFLPFLDYYLGRKIGWWKSVLEKAPFFLLGLAIGIIAILAQESTGYTSDASFHSSGLSTLSYAAWALVTYLVKLFLPISLSAYYPYPIPGIDLPPWVFNAGIPFAISFILLGIYLWYRKTIAGLGLVFFLICLAPMLKIIGVSNFLTADRYTYVAGIGVFLALTSVIQGLNHRFKFALLLIPALFWTWETIQRIPVWKDTETLVNDVLIKHPDVIPARNIRAKLREEKGDFQSALQDYNHAIIIRPQDVRSIRNRGLLMARTGRLHTALEDFNLALSLDSSHPETYINRARLNILLQDLDAAIGDATQAVKQNPEQAEGFNTRGIAYHKQGYYYQAIKDFSEAIRIHPDQSGYYFNRGSALVDSGAFVDAMEDLIMAETLGWHHPQVKLLEAKCLYKQGKWEAAVSILESTLSSHPEISELWILLGEVLWEKKAYQKAEKALNQALILDAGNAEALYMRALTKHAMGSIRSACSDLEAAMMLNHAEAEKKLEELCR